MKVLVVGSGDLAARAFGQLAGHSAISVGQLADVLAAAATCRLEPPELAPHAIVLESRCLAAPDRESLRTLIETAPVILLGTDPGPDSVLDGLLLGAQGHVDWPDEEPGRLEAAIHTVLSGRPALSPRIAGLILDELLRTAPAVPGAGC